MGHPFNESARRVVFLARSEAARLGSSTVGTEHLLLGLLRERRGPAFRLLANRGVSIEAARREVERRSEQHRPVSITDIADITTGAAFEEALGRAETACRASGRADVSSEHLLLALVEDRTSPGGLLLHELGLRPEDVRAELGRLAEDPSIWELMPLESLLRTYDGDSSRWESARTEIDDLRERLRIVSLGMDAAIERNELDKAIALHEEFMTTELRLRQILESG